MKFKKITIIDNCGLVSPEVEKIALLSEEAMIIHNDFPETEKEIIARIGDSDCVLVSWHTKISAKILRSCPSLKIVGMCCSLYDEKSANVDIVEARKLGIEVKGVRDYGDEGTVEFMFAELICLIKGLGKNKWRAEPTELGNKSIGIIGLGTLGQMVAKTALHFGMKVFYFSRTRKPELEETGITYMTLSELMESCDVVATLLPKNTHLLTDQEFKIKKINSILINSSLGLTFEKEPFLDWMKRDKTSFAIFDACGYGNCATEFADYDNIILSNQFSGFTTEAKKRLSQKVLLNLTTYLNNIDFLDLKVG